MARASSTAVALASAAAFATVIGLAIYSYGNFVYGASAAALLIIPMIAATVTFITANFGLSLKRSRNLTRTQYMFTGFGLGFFAVLTVATITLLLFIPPAYYERLAPTVFVFSFSHGGFLGPLLGAAVGFRKTTPPLQS